VCVYVKVSLATCLERNARRERKVPPSEVAHYIDILDGTVKDVVGTGVVDEYIVVHNNIEDGMGGDVERFGEKLYPWVQRQSKTHGYFFDNWGLEDEQDGR